MDERLVPPEDPDSNYGNARRDFLSRVPIPPEQVFPMPVHLPPRRGAEAYEETLRRALGTPPGAFPRFDLVLLGLGRDGHTASLFPGDPVLEETERPVVAVRGGDPRVDRLTLTFPVLNRASRLIGIASGRGKADVVRRVLEPCDTRLPAARVSSRATWLVDAEAASKLTTPA